MESTVEYNKSLIRLMNFLEKAEELCRKCNIKFTEQRRVIAKVIKDSNDHPDVEKVFERSLKLDSNINLATIYRNINLFEHFGILKKHYFGDSRARYESAEEVHHDHLIDLQTNLVIEFSNNDLQKLIFHIADAMGYDLINYNIEIYAVKKVGKLIHKDEIYKEQIKEI